MIRDVLLVLAMTRPAMSSKAAAAIQAVDELTAELDRLRMLQDMIRAGGTVPAIAIYAEWKQTIEAENG
jgi:hypothetical protein